jgi:hypothetical protein
MASADIIKEVARDIRAETEAHDTEVETTPTALVSKRETETLIPKRQNQIPQYKARHLATIGVKTFLTILALVAVASVIDPLTFFSNAGRVIELAKRNLSQWIVLASYQQFMLQKASAEVDLQSKEQRVTVESGSNIYKIAADAYGAQSVLGMDLIKEFNPQVKNLNRVSVGQDLLLPPLTRETLLRQQSDGSYHLIVASFRNPTGASEYGRLLSNKGYKIVIRPRRVSDDLVLHRIEIDGLKNLEEADRIWQTGLRNEWLAFAGNQREPSEQNR